jgi:hypothetical protein
LESTLVMFKEGLFNAFHDWLEKHEDVIGGWYEKLLKEEKKAWEMSKDAISLIASALWMFNMIAQFGVLAGVRPANVNLQQIPEGIDECKAPWRFSLAKYALWVESYGRQ